MINEHIISIEFGSIDLMQPMILTQKHILQKEKMFINWNGRDEWYNVKENTSK
jgi:hypothetical protein